MSQRPSRDAARLAGTDPRYLLPRPFPIAASGVGIVDHDEVPATTGQDLHRAGPARGEAVGLEHERLSVNYRGLQVRLTNLAGNVIHGVID